MRKSIARLLKKLKDVRGQGVLEVFLRFHHFVKAASDVHSRSDGQRQVEPWGGPEGSPPLPGVALIQNAGNVERELHRARQHPRFKLTSLFRSGIARGRGQERGPLTVSRMMYPASSGLADTAAQLESRQVVHRSTWREIISSL